MTDPDQLDQEATEAEQEALQEASQAQALAATGDPNNEAQAKALDNQAFYLTMTARRKHKEAQKIRDKADQLNAQIAEKQRAIDDMMREKTALGDPNELIGAAVRSETRAADYENQASTMSQRDDAYSQSQAEKLRADAQQHAQQAIDRRQEAQTLEAKLVEIDKNVQRLNSEIKDIETKKKSL